MILLYLCYPMHKLVTDKIREEILQRIDAAKSEIFAVVAWFTDQAIYDSLIRALGRDVRFYLITQDDETNSKGGLSFMNLVEAGATVYLNDGIKGGIIHHKFCVIDRNCVIMGSYNWTYSAAKYNHESISIHEGPKVPVDEYLDVFDDLRRRPEIKKMKSDTSRFKHNMLLEPYMIFVEGGSFQMGDVSEDQVYENEIVKKVNVDSFYIGKYPVTFDEFDVFCKDTGRVLPHDMGWGREKRPVINITWFDALEFCNWLSIQEGLDAVYSLIGSSVYVNTGATGYRLPTEEQWEYAARSRGRNVRYGNDSDIADAAKINYDPSVSHQNSYSRSGVFRRHSLPVGALNSPNILGLHDMSGNVWEWCYQQHDDTLNATKVCRGGSWRSNSLLIRTTAKISHLPTGHFDDVGFRLVRLMPTFIDEFDLALAMWAELHGIKLVGSAPPTL